MREAVGMRCNDLVASATTVATRAASQYMRLHIALKDNPRSGAAVCCGHSFFFFFAGLTASYRMHSLCVFVCVLGRALLRMYGRLNLQCMAPTTHSPATRVVTLTAVKTSIFALRRNDMRAAVAMHRDTYVPRLPPMLQPSRNMRLHAAAW